MKYPVAGLMLLLCLALPAWSWSRGGHMTVAYIAYQKLSSTAKSKVDALLVKNPDYSTWVANIPDTPQNRELRAQTAFLRASLWADDIKSKRDYTEDGLPGSNGNKPPNTPEAGQNVGFSDKFIHKYWHFHDTPFSSDHTPTQPPLTPSALTQIPKLRDGLKNGDDDLKSYDLSWLIHLVGDVHQPLHATSRFTVMQPNGDDGGNGVKLCQSTCTGGGGQALHSFWDGLFGTSLVLEDAIDLGDTLLAENPTPPVAASIADPGKWLDESFRLAKKKAYAPPIRKNGGISTTNPTYRQAARETGEAQIVLAGYRLANLINAAWQ